jgi:cobalt-zinc-cadmium efflux system outer membrane protein
MKAEFREISHVCFTFVFLSLFSLCFFSQDLLANQYQPLRFVDQNPILNDSQFLDFQDTTLADDMDDHIDTEKCDYHMSNTDLDLDLDLHVEKSVDEAQIESILSEDEMLSAFHFQIKRSLRNRTRAHLLFNRLTPQTPNLPINSNQQTIFSKVIHQLKSRITTKIDLFSRQFKSFTQHTMNHFSLMKHKLTFTAYLLFPQILMAQEVLDFEQIKKLVIEHNQGLLSAKRDVDIATAQVKTQSAYPNPEVEAIFGYMNTRQPTGKYITPSGSSYSLGLTQPIDAPWTRSARIEVAQKGVELSKSQLEAFQIDLLSLVKQRFFALLKAQDEHIAAKEAKSVVEEIRTKVAKRVEVGESPRYELIKADAELLNAQKEEQSALLRIIQAKAELKSLIHHPIAEDFQIQAMWSANQTSQSADLIALKKELFEQNPNLKTSRIAVEQANEDLAYEKVLRIPKFSLRAAQDLDPTMYNTRVGVVMDIPIWNLRSGQIEEAQYRVLQKQNQLENQTQILSASMEVAYRQYEIAQNQVNALKNGILREAESALRVAQVSYQYGERGILDYLDAQRVLRSARSELINALYELEIALIEIQRLRARI